MDIGSLFGDYTIEGFREIIREEYKKETGLDAFWERLDETQQVIITPTLNYSKWIEDLLGNAIGRLYEEKALRSGKALLDSGLLKEVVLNFNKNKESLNLIGKDVRKSDNKKN